LKTPIELVTIVLYLASLRLSLVPCLIHPKESPARILKLQKDFKTPIIIDPCEVTLDDNSLEVQRFFQQRSLISLLMTSGTLGEPKYAGVSLHNFYYSYKGMKNTLKLSSSSRYLLNLPLNHVAGLAIVFRALFSKATLVIKHPQNSFSCFISQEQISHLSVVSLQLRRWIDEEDKQKYPYLKCVLLGGGPTPCSVITKALQAFIPLYHSYGMTETCSTITCKQLKLNTNYDCGRPLLYRKVKLSKNKEILLSGKTLFLGYFNIEKMQVISQTFLATKDVGLFSKSHNLAILGRKDNMVILKGENVFPEEIERALLTHLDILKACVVLINATQQEPLLVSFIETQSKKIPENLGLFLKDALPSIKHPKYFFLWPASVHFESSKNSKKLRALFQDLALSNILSSS
jgi:O-succinylbenzoic acid--CoA ligase